MDALTKYAKIGLTHNAFYPYKHDPARHERTLAELLERDDIEALDLTIPYAEPYRTRSIERVKASGKATVYNGYLLPTSDIPLSTASPTEQAQMLILSREQADIALEIGSVFFMQSVGADPGEERREQAFENLGIYIRELTAHIRRKRSMPFLIELMDRELDKCSLCGPTEEVVQFVDRLSERVPDVGLVVDVSHIPLMKETFEHTLSASRKYMRHVHLGNCVLKDRSSPWWGDKHPPLGLPGSEIDTPQVAEVLRLLWDLGYLDSGDRPIISLEIRPFPGKSVDETIKDNLNRLNRAWDHVRRGGGKPRLSAPIVHPEC